MMKLLCSIMNDIAGCDGDSESMVEKPEEVAAASFSTSATDMPIGKVQGVRASKSCLWVARPSTPTELLAAIVATAPVHHMTARFLQEQSLDAHLHSDPQRRPLVNLVTARYSPACRCVSDLIAVLTSGISGPLELFDGNLTQLGSMIYSVLTETTLYYYMTSICV